jgi:valyl-tRNA synthetase
VVGFDGKMINTGLVDGLFVKPAREKTLQLLRKKNLLKGERTYTTIRKTCYKCKHELEPLPREQWFIKVKTLADNAIAVVKTGKIAITPKNFEAIYFQWLDNLHDWNISRQIAWGIRIPAWKCSDCDAWVITEGEIPKQCHECKSLKLAQDPDTFDTWFSSGQWPYLTLNTGKTGDFDKFYPTDVMETAYDILKAWVTRMVMLGLYITDDIPFKRVLFHGIVNDPYGKKMSKSRGNVINPLELVDEYGADAVRFALIYGNATGNDQALSYPKLEAARKFANKIWNIGRFIEMQKDKITESKSQMKITTSNVKAKNTIDQEWVTKVNNLNLEITKYLDSYQFNLAAERLYEFIWHEFADIYIEDVKNRIDNDSYSILILLYTNLLLLLHPFMPFITEKINQELKLENKMLIISPWPSTYA